MLDLARIQRIRLTSRPIMQRLVAGGILSHNYERWPGIDIRFENQERVPDRPVIYAMNHTDRFNYFPFQYRLWRQCDRFTATWVKGKYYETAFVGAFMEFTNNIPTVSRGYLIAKDFALTTGKSPSSEQYKALRDWVDAAATHPETAKPDFDIPYRLLQEKRNPLGVEFDPASHDYATYINRLFGRMMKRFVELNAETFDRGLDLIVFPQGTRSVRLSKGHIGLSQIALKYKQTIVPVGCSGCDLIYPGGNPFAKKGTVTYRFGEPLAYEDLSKFHTSEDFTPFTPEAEEKHRDNFQGCVDLVMDRINGLVDPPYQYTDDQGSEGVAGAERFI